MAQGGTSDRPGSPTQAEGGTGGDPLGRNSGLWGDRLAVLVATVGGIGWLRPGPGTWGSLAGMFLPLAWRPWIEGPDGAAGLLDRGLAILIVCGFSLLAVPVCTRAGRVQGRVDPGCIVLDEFLAMQLVLALPERWSWFAAAVGFGLFRLFDIAKPWPVSRCELLPAGWGVMADDLAAGAIAGAILLGVLAVF
jgi:phosphatidylglycerophosphatase A